MAECLALSASCLATTYLTAAMAASFSLSFSAFSPSSLILAASFYFLSRPLAKALTLLSLASEDYLASATFYSAYSFTDLMASLELKVALLTAFLVALRKLFNS